MIRQARHQFCLQDLVLGNRWREVQRVRVEALGVVLNATEEVVLELLVALALPLTGSNSNFDVVVEMAEGAHHALATAHGRVVECARGTLLLRMEGRAYRSQLPIDNRNSLHQLGCRELLLLLAALVVNFNWRRIADLVDLVVAAIFDRRNIMHCTTTTAYLGKLA